MERPKKYEESISSEDRVQEEVELYEDLAGDEKERLRELARKKYWEEPHYVSGHHEPKDKKNKKKKKGK